MKFEKDFKEAISNLPSKEKDKLILRLLRRDLLLANKLQLELLSTTSVDEKRREMEKTIVSRVKSMTSNFYSPGYLMLDMRYLSGEITYHVKTTSDKFGDASLNLLMLNEVLSQNLENINKYKNQDSVRLYKFSIYTIARAFKITMLINKLDADYLIELRDGLTKLGKNIASSDYLMRTAINNGLDVNWLIQADIPEGISDIHKKIRAQGFLR